MQSRKRVSSLTAVLILVSASRCVVSTGPEGALDHAEIVDAGPHCHERTQLMLRGVTCPSCGEVVTASLLAVNGVVSAQVTLTPPQADVVYCDSLSVDDLTRAIQSAGYKASVAN
jgi:copper chaperone CopZ